MDKAVLLALHAWYKEFLIQLDNHENKIDSNGTMLVALSKLLSYDSDVYYHGFPRSETCELAAFEIPLVKDIYEFAQRTDSHLTVHAATYIALFCETAEDILLLITFLQLCNAFSNKPVKVLTALHVQNTFSLQPLNAKTREKLWEMAKIKDPDGTERISIFYITELLEIIKEAKEQDAVFAQFPTKGFNKIH